MTGFKAGGGGKGKGKSRMIKKSEDELLEQYITENGWQSAGSNMIRAEMRESFYDNLKGDERGLIGFNRGDKSFETFLKDWTGYARPNGLEGFDTDEYKINTVDMRRVEKPHDFIDLVRQSERSYIRDLNMFSVYERPHVTRK